MLQYTIASEGNLCGIPEPLPLKLPFAARKLSSEVQQKTMPYEEGFLPGGWQPQVSLPHKADMTPGSHSLFFSALSGDGAKGRG